MTTVSSSTQNENHVCTKPDDVPNRVCIDEASPFYFDQYRRLGVSSQGCNRKDVVEFDVAGGWMRVFLTTNGRIRTERGKPITVKINRQFDVFWRADPAAAS